MSHRRIPILVAVLMLAGTALGGCGSSSQDPAITLYNGQHEQTTAALVAAFEKQTGIHVAVRSGDEAELADQIMQEGSSSPADVFYTENTPVLEELREHGMLAPVASSTLAQIPSRYSSPNGDWVGVSARVSVLVYNTSLIKPAQLPGSILELAEPQWKAKVAFAPSETDFQPLITAITKLDGAAAAERWLQGLQANSKLYPDNETVVAQVNNGESAVGIINHYYWFRLRAELGGGAMHSALHYFAQESPGDLVDVSGAAILKSTGRPVDAQRFLAFLVSREGQETIAHSHSYEYPLRPGVSPAPGLRPFAELRPAPVTSAELGDGSAALALEQKLGLL